MRKTPNKVILSDDPIGVNPPESLISTGIILRAVFAYIPAVGLLFEREMWQWGLPFLAVLELTFSISMHIGIIKQKSPYAAIIALSLLFYPPLFFLSALLFLSIYSVSPWYYLLFFCSYSASVWLVFYQLNRINFKIVLAEVNKQNVFVVAEKGNSEAYYFKFFRDGGPEAYGYKQSLIDSLMSKWVWIPLFIIIPVAQLTVFTTPNRDFELAAFMLSFGMLIMAIGAHSMSFHLFLNWRLLRMKEHGEI